MLAGVNAIFIILGGIDRALERRGPRLLP